ncbi:MAG: apolipoprotein N-acyltransferase [Gammaproteobacteria bacterium]
MRHRRAVALAAEWREGLANKGWLSLAGDLASLAAGVILPLAFAPFELAPLAVLSLAALFYLWDEVSPRRAFWRGWLYGLGMLGTGVSWVQISIHQFGMPVLAFSVTVTAGFIAFVALYPGLIGALANRWFRVSAAARFLVVLPALWTLMEWFKGWVLTGFPWLNVGYSQVDTPLAGLAPVFGVYGVGFAVALSAGLLCAMFRNPSRLGYPVFLSVLWIAALVLGRVTWTEAQATKSLAVALIQGNVAQAMKWLPAERQATIDRYAGLTASFWGKVDVVVWPETAIPEFYTETTPYVRVLTERARQTGTELLLGVPYRDPDGERYYNAVTTIGRQAGIYRKRHLVPFGEYLPFPVLLGKLLDFLDIPMSSFSAGSRAQAPLVVAGVPVGVSICYEDAFGEEVIEQLPVARLLVNVSNDAWFGDSIAPHQHLEMARMRALEGGRFLLRATNNGISAVVDHRGKVVAQAPQFRPYTLKARVRARTGATPYVMFGNAPMVALAAGLLAAALVFCRVRRPPQ